MTIEPCELCGADLDVRGLAEDAPRWCAECWQLEGGRMLGQLEEDLAAWDDAA